MDKNDSQAGRFLSYLVAALQQADHTIGSEAAQPMAASQQTPPEAGPDQSHQGPGYFRGEVALVLDDYQFVSKLQVLHLMALGRTNQEIAQQLMIAPGTVKAHTASIHRKLDVVNPTEAAAYAKQLGIIPKGS